MKDLTIRKVAKAKVQFFRAVFLLLLAYELTLKIIQSN